jgi:hypothetical protein
VLSLHDSCKAAICFDAQMGSENADHLGFDETWKKQVLLFIGSLDTYARILVGILDD